MRIVGVSDHTAAYYNPAGLDVSALERHTRENRVLRGFSNELSIDPGELLEQPCDLLVPAAMERVIDAHNVGKLRCRIIAEGANGPTTPAADAVLEKRKDEIFVVPDLLCNAGGVIVSYFEWVQGLQQFFWTEDEVMERLYTALDRSWTQVRARSKKDGISNRKAALAIGVQTVRRAKEVRGLFP